MKLRIRYFPPDRFGEFIVDDKCQIFLFSYYESEDFDNGAMIWSLNYERSFSYISDFFDCIESITFYTSHEYYLVDRTGQILFKYDFNNHILNEFRWF